MTAHWNAALCLLLVSAFTACGARSSLRVGQEQRSGGGAAGGGGEGGFVPTGGGPATGGGPSCDSITFTAPRSFDTLTNHIARAPILVPTSLDDSVVSLVVRADMDPPIIDGNSMSTQVTFEPWGLWPDLPLGEEHALVSGSVATVAPRTREDGLSVLTSFSTFASGPGIAAITGAATDVDDPAVQTLGLTVGTPRFITGRGNATWGFGVETEGATLRQGTVGTVNEASFTFQDDVGCDPRSLQMDGARRGGFFIAVATDACSGAVALRVVVFDDEGVALRYSPGSYASIEQLYLVPRRDGGSWLLYQPGGEPLYAEWLDAKGIQTGERYAVIDDPDLAFDVRHRIAVSAAGDGVAVVFPRDGDNIPPFELRVLDGFGQQVVSEGFELPGLAPQPSATERLALLASPDGQSLLLAWSQDSFIDEVAGSARTYVTRIDCVDPGN